VTIHAPTYPNAHPIFRWDGLSPLVAAAAWLDLCEQIDAAQSRIFLNGLPERKDDAPAVVDDSPAAMIARLTAGEQVGTCDSCGAVDVCIHRGSYTRAMYDDVWMCEDCHSQARMEE